MRSLNLLTLFTVIVVLPAFGKMPSDSALSRAAAKAIFDEASTLSAVDGGRLWGTPLYGPMMIVDRDSRVAIANQPVASFGSSDAVYSGVLPDGIGVANTIVEWQGTRWTMLVWPLPGDVFERRAIIAHELWHRVQDDLGLPMSNPPNLHLGTRDGRVWLRLEWRALADALRASGEDQKTAIVDALYFRGKRLSLFPDAGDEERQLLLHEGLAEYTGYILAGKSAVESRDMAVAALGRAEEVSTFVRSFAYSTGAAYGLLLDQLDSDWRIGLGARDDLADLLAQSVGYNKADHEMLGNRTSSDRADASRGLGASRTSSFESEAVERYDGIALMAEEDHLEERRKQRLADWRRKFVNGPTITLEFAEMNVQFDPGTVDALGDLGNVYESMRLSDSWGVLTVTGGAMIKADWRAAIVPATAEVSGREVIGEGYMLKLADGWMLTAGARPGDLRVARMAADKTASAIKDPQERTFVTRDDVTVYGDLYSLPDTTADLILLFHQGASNARAEYASIAPRLQEAGYRVFAIDQRRGGSRFGGENRTVAALASDREYSYCDCYVDLIGALEYARETLGADKVIVWGSSYSAALVFRLAVDYPEWVKGVLAFSPASGDPMRGCKPEPFAAQTKAPAIVLRPVGELQLEHVAMQFELFQRMGLPTYVADPGVHGSSMLNPNRVEGDVEPTWNRVLAFLSEIPKQ